MKSVPECIFCKIVARDAEASIIYGDDNLMAFMNIRPINPGEFLIIPKEHIDHFCDISDELSCQIVIHAQRLSRNLRAQLQPRRVGLVVHGWGVPHAHLVVVPMHDSTDIISAKHGYIDGNQIKYSDELLREPGRKELDEMAQRLA